MAGYSGTPLPKKLGIKPQARVLVHGGPDGFLSLLEPLPNGVVTAATGDGPFDVIVAFFRDQTAFRADFPSLARRLAPAGGLWVGWPKRTSGVATDLSENPVRDFGLSFGLVDNKVCAIDDVWSGLRFAIRLADRPKAGTVTKKR